MPGQIDTITFTAYQITGACWRILREEDSTLVNIIYSDQTLITPYRVFIADDLTELLAGWKNRSLKIPITDIHIRVDRSIAKHNLNAQVDAIDLNWLDQNFNLVKISKVLGIVRLVIRLFVDAKINLKQMENIFLYFLQEKKARRSILENRMDWLENNGYLTAAQKVAFWAGIDAAL